jgi:hypothetical protein
VVAVIPWAVLAVAVAMPVVDSAVVVAAVTWAVAAVATAVVVVDTTRNYRNL